MTSEGFLTGMLLALFLHAAAMAQDNPEMHGLAPGEREYAERAERLLAAAAESGDELGTARAQYALAEHMKALRLYPQALAHARLARAAARLAGDTDMLLAADVAYGASLGQLSRTAEAIEVLLPALERARALENVEQQLWALLALDTAYFHAKRLEQAEGYARQGLELARASGDHAHVARFLSNLGLIAYTRGDIAEAEALIQEALTIDGLPPDVQRTLAIASISLAGATDVDAGARAREAIAAARRGGSTFHEGFATAQLGDILCNNGEFQEAAQAFEAADSMLREGDSLTDLQRMHEVWAECLERAGEFESALAREREAKALLEQSQARRQDEIRQAHEIAFRTEHRLAELARLTAEEQTLQARVARQRAFTGWLAAGAFLLLGVLAVYWFRNRRLREHRDAQLALQQARIDLLARTSHEIRNPAQGIVGILEGRMAADRQWADDRELSAALSAARMVGHLANDYLDLALLEQGRLSIDNEAICHVPTLIERVECLSRSFLDKHRQTLSSRVGDRVPAWIVGDAERLSQVLLNLISNAAYYAGAGEIELTLTVETNPRRLVFEVGDRGPGFDASDLANFDPYVRGSQRSGNPRGSGLGLAVSARIIDAMGGEIKARGRAGGGASVVVALPLREIEEAPQEVTATPATAPEETVFAQAAGRRVLIVDDDPFARLGLRAVVESVRGRVSEADAGGDLKAALRNFDPEIVLLDYRLGADTGIELAKRIRNWDAEDSLSRTVVIVSGSSDDMAEPGAEVDGWLVKPVGRMAMLELLASN